MQQAEARGEALTKSRRYSKAGGYSGSGGAAAVHFLNKLASLASFICRLALSPLSLLSHIWMENWQAFCQQSHERLFSNLSARSDEFFSGGENPPWMWSLILIRSFIFPFNLTSQRLTDGSQALCFCRCRVEIFSWRSKHTNQRSVCSQVDRPRSSLKQVAWNKIFNGVLWTYTSQTVYGEVRSVCRWGKQTTHTVMYLCAVFRQLVNVNTEGFEGLTSKARSASFIANYLLHVGNGVSTGV